MRFSVSLGWCGYLLDFSVGPAEDEAEPEFLPYQDAGTTGSTIVGFVPNIAPQWDDQGSVHTLDPGEGDEDR